jgi:hypothetical protein
MRYTKATSLMSKTYEINEKQVPEGPLLVRRLDCHLH